MKVLILSNEDGGLYVFRREVVAEIAKHHEVHFSVPNGPFVSRLEELGCIFEPCTALDRRSINPLKDIKLFRYYFSLIKKMKPDVVLTYTIKPNVYGGFACRLLRTPYIPNITGLGTSIENGGIMSILTTRLYKIGIKGASCIFFQNEANEKTFRKKNLVIGITKVIPGSGVNLIVHNYEPYPDDVEGIRFLFVGRIMKDKGIDELLEAFIRLQNESPQISLDIVGFCEESYEEKLKNAALHHAIVFHGPQSDVHSFYKRAHCTVLPSYHEGKSNVMLESSATGRPVITTRVPGCQETFEESITGFGCEVKDVNSLYEAMSNFVKLPNDKRAEMGKAARKKMEIEYDRQIVINAYMEEIQNVGSKSK